MITGYKGFILIKLWIVEYKGLNIRLTFKIINSTDTWGVLMVILDYLIVDRWFEKLPNIILIALIWIEKRPRRV